MKRDAITEPCTGPGCDRPARTHGLCNAHYKQTRKYGRTYKLNPYHRSTLPRRAALVALVPAAAPESVRSTGSGAVREQEAA